MRMAQHHRIPLVIARRSKHNEFGGVLDSTLVAKPEVHVVMAANHVNPKLQSNSRKRRNVRSGGLSPAGSW